MLQKMTRIAKPLNPFFLSSDIPDAYFCDREKETRTLLRHIEGRSNVLLMSPRRMGKSGLIHHIFRKQEIRKNYYTFYIDLYETASMEEFIQKLGREIVGKLSGRGFDVLKRFLGALPSLRGVFSLDPTTGMPAFSVGIGDIPRPESTLDEIFSYLEKADKPCIVAIDEFQRIANYEQKNVEAILRSRIQFMHNTTFIFAGSERSVLAQMFGSAARPFYQSTATMSLEAIDKEKYTNFVSSLFRQYGKKIEATAVFDLYDLLQGYTYYLQRVLNQAFPILPENRICDSAFLLECTENILTDNTDTFQEILSGLTVNQRSLLEAVSLEGTAVNITSADFIKKHGMVSVSSVQSAARALLKRQLLTRSPKKTYYLDDKFLELWLIRQHGLTPAIRLEQNRSSVSL